jgi:hypothetical protein
LRVLYADVRTLDRLSTPSRSPCRAIAMIRRHDPQRARQGRAKALVWMPSSVYKRLMATLQPEHSVGGLGWLIATLGPLALSGILVIFRGELFATNAALVLVLAVLAGAITGGRLGGVVSAVVAALCFDFFFTRPYYSFTINRHDDVETTVVLLIVGLVVGELVIRTHHSRQLARASRREVEQIRRVAELAAGRGPTGRLISIVEREVVDLLRARAARFERPPFPTVLPQLGHGRVTIGGDDGGPSRQLGPPNEVEVPVWGRGRELGRLVVVLPFQSAGIAIPPDDRALAVALVDQLGAVLAAATETP